MVENYWGSGFDNQARPLDLNLYSVLLLVAFTTNSWDLFLKLAGSLANLVLSCDNVLLVLFHVWQDINVVNEGCSLGCWMEKPHHEDKLQEVVEWNESQNESCEVIKDVEESKHDPISEPLFVVIGTFTLKGQEAHEAWVGNSDGSGNVLVSDTEHDANDSCVESISRELVDAHSEHFCNFFHFFVFLSNVCLSKI